MIYNFVNYKIRRREKIIRIRQFEPTQLIEMAQILVEHMMQQIGSNINDPGHL